MSDCTNPELRQKLLAYEMAILDDEEKQELELHLYECDACYHDLDQFANWAEYLRSSRVVRDSVLSESAQSKGESKKTRFTRLLITIAAALVLAVPAYRYWLQPSDIEITQTISLAPSRAAGGGVIDLELGGMVEIRFVAEEMRPDHRYNVTIATRDGTLVHEETVSEFNGFGQGSVVLPVDILEPGFYTLSVIDQFATPVVSLVDYTFRAE